MKSLKNLFKIGALASLFLFNACSDDDDNTPMDEPTDPTATIVEAAQATADLSNLVAALTTADLSANNDLVATLNGEGPFTVLAPSNAAFTDLFARLDGFESLDDFDTEAEQDLLAAILSYHVVAGSSVTSDQLSDGQMVTTVQGESVTVSTEGGVFFIDAASESAEVTMADVPTSNGTVHIINKVLLPQEAIDALNGALLFSITDLAISTPSLSNLVAALVAANGDLPNVLRGAGPFTVLAPTDDAFAAFLDGTALEDVPVEVTDPGFAKSCYRGRN